MPFLRSLVVATAAYDSLVDLDQLARRVCERRGASGANDDGVLDTDPTATGQVDTGLDGHRHALDECSRGRLSHQERRFVDLEPYAVTESVRADVAGVLDPL